jgi:hypothetical protein
VAGKQRQRQRRLAISWGRQRHSPYASHELQAISALPLRKCEVGGGEGASEVSSHKIKNGPSPSLLMRADALTLLSKISISYPAPAAFWDAGAARR